MRNFLRILGTAGLGFFLILLARTALISAATECSAGCVTTHNYDDSRDNVNPGETILKASNLSSLHAVTSPDLHGTIYTQPLYVSNLVTSAGTKNVVFVATEENWVYALDGDQIGNPPLWQTNLNNAGEISVPLVELPLGCGTIQPEVGITGTPVVDLAKNLLFVVSAHFDTSTHGVTQRVNALNLADGTAASSSLDIPTALQSLGFSFNVAVQQQRAALALDRDANGNSVIYVAWASYCDAMEYSGKIAAFEFAGSLTALTAFDDEAAGGKPFVGPAGGIWMGGVAPAVVGSVGSSPARLFFSTGNGDFLDGAGYGQSVLSLGGSGASGPLQLTGSYTIHAWNILNDGSGSHCKKPLNLPPPYPSGTTMCSPGDFDLSSGGVILVRPSGSGNVPPGSGFVVLAAGKQGVFYVIDPSNMKHKGADTRDPCGAYAIQCFAAIQLPLPCCNNGNYGNRGGAAFWAGNATYQENVLYVIGSEDSAIRAYQMNPGGKGTFNTSLFGSAPPPDPNIYGRIPYPGASPVVSWDATNGQPQDAILWVLDTAPKNMQERLFAYQAVPDTAGGTLSMVWKDSRAPRPTSFMVPTVINGHVYVAGGVPNRRCLFGACPGRVVSWQQ